MLKSLGILWSVRMLVLSVLLLSNSGFALIGGAETANVKKTLGILLFGDFDLLDVSGPIEMFANIPGVEISLIAEQKGLVKSGQGVSLEATSDLASTGHLDLLLVPGGMGTRREVDNEKLLTWLKEQAKNSDLVLSVCTGSALLAKAGLLDNRKATSNKIAFNWVRQQGPKVKWVEKARFVDDGNIITSSGIAAGIDMSLYVIARLFGPLEAERIANFSEYFWNKDPNNDPFTKNILAKEM